MKKWIFRVSFSKLGSLPRWGMGAHHYKEQRSKPPSGGHFLGMFWSWRPIQLFSFPSEDSEKGVRTWTRACLNRPVKNGVAFCARKRTREIERKIRPSEPYTNFFILAILLCVLRGRWDGVGLRRLCLSFIVWWNCGCAYDIPKYTFVTDFFVIIILINLCKLQRIDASLC